jgi:hypothetical protein
VIAFLLVEDDVAGDPGAEPHPVLVDATLLEQRDDHAVDTEGAHQPKGMQLEELTRAMPGAWGEQREHCAGSSRTQGTGCC